MNSRYILASLTVALCAVGLFQLAKVRPNIYPEYQVSAGQVADFDLVAPFDFPVLKPETQLQQEFQQTLSALGKPHWLDGNVEFEAYNNLNRLFDLLFESAENRDWESIKVSAQRLGFQLSDAARNLLADPDRVRASYNDIRDSLIDLYRVGIYSNVSSDSILVVTEAGRRRYPITRYYQLDRAKRVLEERFSGAAGYLVRDNIDQFVKPNLLINEAKYKQLQQELRASLNPVAGVVRQNDLIVSKNQRLSEEQINKLNSLTREYQNRGVTRSPLYQWLGIMGLLLYIGAVMFAFNLYLSKRAASQSEGNPGYILLNLGFLVLLLLTVLGGVALKLEFYQIPLAMIVLAVAVLGGIELALLYNTCAVLMLAPFFNWDAYNLILLLLSMVLTLILVSRYKSKHSFFRIWMFQFLAWNFVMVVLNLQFFTGNDLGGSLGAILRNTGYSLITTTISVLGCLAIVTYFERRWNRATKQVLLELLDFNHPLLKKLATSAEGTYHHSLIVGNLAERAAEAIGANSLLARVGSYYHDIGKVAAPEIFTENNADSARIHNEYSPEQSAELIRSHVREGVVLAGKHKLPQAVADIISQHHGTSHIRYFLDAAQRSGEPIDMDSFRYPGPLPQTKESALVMLADVVESTAKSKSSASEAEIQKIVEDALQRLIKEGQFDAAPITLKELVQARDAMSPVLASIYRKRLDYPEERTV